MFRIITQKFKHSQISLHRPKGVFGSPKAIHSQPRRYKYFSSAVYVALKIPGIHEVMDDFRNTCAVVKNGELLGTADGYIYVPFK